MEPVCVTEKVCFSSKAAALQFGLSVKERKKDKGHVAAYNCDRCYYWHLTSGTTTKHKKRCSRFREESNEKYKGNLKPYMFNGGKPKKKKKR